MAQNRQINHIAFSAIGLALCIFILISLISFDVRDWPNPDVAPAHTIHNLCGLAGAYLAYYCNYYAGPGAAMVALIALTVYLVLHCMRRAIEQMILRSIGVVLIGSVLAASAYLINPGDAHSLSQGNGGILGIALGHFLLAKTAMTGAVLILIAAMIVGLLLAADNVLFLLPGLLFQGAERLRRAGPLLAAVGATMGAKGKSTKLEALAVACPKRKAAQQEIEGFEEEVEEYEYEDEESELEDETADSEDQDESNSLLRSVSSALTGMLGRSDSSAGPLPGHEDLSNYELPPMELLDEPVRGFASLQEKVVREKGKILEQTLSEFNIDAQVVEAETGPVITMFELQLAPGIKVARISNLANDLARSLGAPAVRIVAPIPGKHTIGIEVPNSEKEKVRIKELMQLAGNKPNKMQVPLFLGKDASGEALVVDLTKLPHLLIAGTTGSGKSVCINSIIASILLTQRPDMVKLTSDVPDRHRDETGRADSRMAHRQDGRALRPIIRSPGQKHHRL